MAIFCIMGIKLKTAIFGILCLLYETQTSYFFPINDVTASIHSSGIHWAGDMLAEIALMCHVLWLGKNRRFSESWHRLKPQTSASGVLDFRLQKPVASSTTIATAMAKPSLSGTKRGVEGENVASVRLGSVGTQTAAAWTRITTRKMVNSMEKVYVDVTRRLPKCRVGQELLVPCNIVRGKKNKIVVRLQRNDIIAAGKLLVKRVDDEAAPPFEINPSDVEFIFPGSIAASSVVPNVTYIRAVFYVQQYTSVVARKRLWQIYN